MARTATLLIVGALIGAGLTFAAMRIAASQDWQGGTLRGPVAVFPAGAEKHGYLGVIFSNEPGRSLVVAEVSSVAAAAPTHLLVGDHVTSINARPVATFEELQSLIADCKPGETVDLGILRNEQPTALKMRLLSIVEIVAARQRDGDSSIAQ